MRALAGALSLVTALAAAAACGDEDKVRHLPDAPPPPDAAPDGPPSGPVTLTITNGDAPIEGVRVVFQNPDGAVIADTATDAAGKASATVDAGAYVTAIDPLPVPQGIAQRDVRTFVGVKPGDQLVLHEDGGGATITMNVTVPIASGGSQYLLHTSCGSHDISGGGGSGTDPGGTIFLSGCGATTDVVVEVRDVNGEPASSISKSNVALVDGGTLDLTAEAYAAIPAATFAFSNVPATLSFVDVFAQLATAHGPLLQVFTEGTVTGGAVTVSAKRPVVPGATALVVSSFRGSTMTRHTVAEWGPAASAYAVDVGALLLPDFTSAPVLDPAAHTIAWTLAATGAQPDASHVIAHYTRETPGLLAWRWELVAPTPAAIVLPVLPGDLAQFNPVATDNAFYQVDLGKFPGGYDALRPHLLSGDTPFGTSGTGRAVLASLVENLVERAGPRATVRAWSATKSPRR